MNLRKNTLPTAFFEQTTSFRPFNDVFLGLDDILRAMDAHLGAIHSQLNINYPPHNLTETDHGYTLQLAVAGFGPDDIKVEFQKRPDNTAAICISGKIETKIDQSVVVAKNIATRQFSREFLLADGLLVSDLSLKHGMLTIEILKPEPKTEEPKVKLLTIRSE